MVACVSAGAAGQVQQVQNGQQLDANPGVGRGGFNTAMPVSALVNSQLYITGQVSGLAGFRDRVGYVAPGQLDLVLPSATIDDFNRQGAGITDATRNRPYLLQPYYDPSKTTMYLSRALENQASGMNLPAIAASVPTAISQQLYVDAMAKYGTISTSLEPRAPITIRSDTTLGGRVAAAGNALSVQPAPYEQAAAPAFSGLFALPRGNDQLDLQRELYAVAHRGEMVNARVKAEIGGRDPGTDAAAQADSLAALAGGTAAGAPGTGAFGQDASGRTRGGALGVPAGQGPINQDVFLDMLMKMRQAREQKAAGPTSAPAVRQPEGAAPGLAPGVAPGMSLTPPPGRKGLVEIGKDKAVVIHGLAGLSKDLFNMNMVRAGQEMQAHKYYDAAQMYETASLVDRRNPLAHVGMGLSLLGAGESLSAAYQLSQAVTMFPPLMETRLDLPGMVDPIVIQSQLDRLDSRIAAADPESKRMLQFLAMFLYRNSNEPGKAKTYAEQLMTTSKNNAVLRAYADLILTGKGPGDTEDNGRPKLEPSSTRVLPLAGVPAPAASQPVKVAPLPGPARPAAGGTTDKNAPPAAPAKTVKPAPGPGK